MALAHITEDDFTELLREEAEDVFTDGRVVQGQGIEGWAYIYKGWESFGHGGVVVRKMYQVKTCGMEKGLLVGNRHGIGSRAIW